MLAYFLVISPIALLAWVSPARQRIPLIWGTMFIVLVLFVGLRHHVGMDWNNYLVMIERANRGGLLESWSVAEPGYATLLWISGQMGWGVYGAYFMGTVIFAAGLFRYARTMPHPWIALLVAMPFLVFVVSMSAARQAVAIGVLLWLTAEWSKASARKRVALILLASSFHLSAIGFLGFAFLDTRLPRWSKILGSGLMAVGLLFILQRSGQAEYYNSAYGTGQTDLTQSSGAIFHTLLNGGPALMCFLLGRRARSVLIPDAFHRQLAILAIALVPLAFVMSVAAGRLTLYLFPVSMWFFSALPLLLRDKKIRLALKLTIGLAFVGLLAFWLSVGNSAAAQKNYRNALFVPGYELNLCCK